MGQPNVYPLAWLRVATGSYRPLSDRSLPAAGPAEAVAIPQQSALLLSIKIKSESLYDKVINRRDDQEISQALSRYHHRVITRAAPLMFFSGVGVVKLADNNRVYLCENSQWQADLFPSSEALAAQPSVRAATPYRLNESLVVRGGVLCAFVEQARSGADAGQPGYRLLCLRRQKPLQTWLDAAPRELGWQDLEGAVQAVHPSAKPPAIAAYLGELSDLGIIQDRNQNPAPGGSDDPEGKHPQPEEGDNRRDESFERYRLSTQLGGLDADKIDVLQRLIKNEIVKLKTGTGSGLAGEKGAVRGHALLNAELQHKIRDGGLSAAGFLALAEAIAALPQLWSSGLAGYRQRIADHLAAGSLTRRVPLLELTYAVAKSARLEDTLPPRSEDVGPPWSSLRPALWQAELTGQEEIQLTSPARRPDAASRDPSDLPQVPRWVEARARLLCQGGRDRLWLLACTSQVGQGLTRLLQRRPHDPMLRQLQTIWAAQAEAAAPAILAEITCGGGGRARDISRRPLTYPFQIVLHGAASVPPSHQIHPRELSVFLAADGPVLWWERAGVPVIAHQLSTLLLAAYSPVVHVLLALDPRPRSFALHLPTQGLPVRTARLAYGDVILQPQTWLLPPNLQQALRQPRRERDEAELRRLIAGWRERYQVPRVVRLGDMEHNAVDLQGPHALSELETLVQDGLDRVTEEFLDDDSPVQGSDGPRVAEAVVHIELPHQGGRTPPTATAVPPSPPGSLQTEALRRAHVFPPGSSWLYLKLYYGPGLGSDGAARLFIDDDLLGRFVSPLFAELEKQALISDFHFVRYADPEAHLRLRLRPSSDDPEAATRLLGWLFPRLAAEAQARAFERFVVDTYVREVDRYGGPALIALAEQLFTEDSRLSLRLLAACYRGRLDAELDLRRLLPIVTFHLLFRGFGFDLPARERYLSALRAGSTIPDWRKRQRDAEYRRLAGRLQALLSQLEGDSPAGDALWGRSDVRAWYGTYEDAVRVTASQFQSLEAERRTPLIDIVGALFHMHCNRLLGSPELESDVVYFAQRSAQALLSRRAAAQRSQP